MINEDTKISLSTVARLIGLFGAIGGGYVLTNDRVAAVESRQAATETLQRAAKLEDLPSRLASMEATLKQLEKD
jgi:DUF1009 family protein